MSSEARMRQTVNRVLRRAGLDPVSVENPAHPGTPDVNYVGGWIELKQRGAWPSNVRGRFRVVRCEHFSTEQRIWLSRRELAGGRTFLIWRIGRDWLLFRGSVAANVVGNVPEPELRRAAYKVWASKALMEKELVECLSR